MKKHFRKLKSLGAAMLACVLVLGLFSPAANAAGAGNILHRSDVNISDSLSFVNTVHDDSGSRQEGFSFEFSPGGDTGVVIWYGSKLSETATITEAAAQLEQQGYYVLGGMNADFFSVSTGLPLGTVISGGKLISTSDESLAVCFMADGSAAVTKPVFDISITNNGGGDPTTAIGYDGTAVDNTGRVTRIGYFNKLRNAYAIYLLDSDFADTNRAEREGRNVLMRIDSGSAVAGGTMELTVTELYEGSTPSKIPEGYMLLTASHLCPYYDELKSFAVGDRLTANFGCEDPVLKSAVSAVGCGDLLIENGSITDSKGWDSAISSTNPRTLLGIKADGSIILSAYDGRAAHSAGLSLKKAAELMLSRGCVTAVNLDGGGSTTALFRSPDGEELKVMNSPSSGKPRSCATYIFFVSRSYPNGVASRLYLTPADPVVLAGSKISFDSISARDAGWRLMPTPAGISSSVSFGLGSFDPQSLSFTASPYAASGSISLGYGIARGSTTVTVVSEVSSLKVSRAGETRELSSVVLEPGEKLELEVTATAHGVTAMADPTVYEYTLSEGLGEISEDGVLTASRLRGVSGTLTVAFGSTKKQISVSIPATKARIIENFEGGDSILDGGSNMSVTTAAADVYRGRAAGVIDYDLTTGSALYLLPQALQLSSAPERIVLAAKGSGVSLSLMLQDSGGTARQIDFGELTADYAWYGANTGLYGSCSLLGFMLTGSGSGRLYIDQLLSPADSSTDTTAPTIELNYEDGRLSAYLADNSGMLFTEDSVSLSVDGKAAAFTLQNNLLTSELYLDGGAHCISVTAGDAFGSLSRATLTLSGGYDASPFEDVATEHWAFEQICALASDGVIQGNGEGLFNPDNAVTREQFCTMLSRRLGLDTAVYDSIELPFTDTGSISSWALGHVKAVYALGYVGGKAAADGTVYFAPGANITRAEIFTLIGRLTEKGFAAPLDFTDGAEIPAWAADGVSTVVGMGLVNGYTDGSIRPGRTASRAEVAKLLFNI